MARKARSSKPTTLWLTMENAAISRRDDLIIIQLLLPQDGARLPRCAISRRLPNYYCKCWCCCNYIAVTWQYVQGTVCVVFHIFPLNHTRSCSLYKYLMPFNAFSSNFWYIRHIFAQYVLQFFVYLSEHLDAEAALSLLWWSVHVKTILGVWR